MPLKVEVDSAIENGKPFKVTLSVDPSEDPGTFNMTLSVKGVPRKFVLAPSGLPALSQSVEVQDPDDYIIENWGVGAIGDLIVVKLVEVGGARSGSDKGAIVP